MKRKISVSSDNVVNQEENKKNLISLLHDRISAVAYFTTPQLTIELFRSPANNAEFRELCEKELNEIRAAIDNGNRFAPRPLKSREYMNFCRLLPEVPVSQLEQFFQIKKEEALQGGLKNPQWIAVNEIHHLESHYCKCLNRFPVFRQWKWFLENVPPEITKSERGEPQKKELQPTTIGNFIALARASEAEPQGNMAAEEYARKVCDKYKLNDFYSDVVRQQLSKGTTRKQEKKVIEKILPLIPTDKAKIILEHIEEKRPDLYFG